MRHSTLALALGLTVLGACSNSDASKSGASAADYVAGTATSVDRFSSPNGRFTVDLPSLWRGYYKGIERADTTAGARFSVEFVFAPEAAWKAEPRTLMVIRIFPKAVWETIAAKPGPPMAVQIGAKYDELMLSVINNPQGLSLMAK
jgi:hypothetical protein